jgi:hypothetical protein
MHEVCVVQEAYLINTERPEKLPFGALTRLGMQPWVSLPCLTPTLGRDC